MEVSVPLAATWKADTVPCPAPSCAFETNSWDGFVGRNSLPNGPRPCAGERRAGRGGQPPVGATAKLSISEVLTRVPTSLVPVELKRTSPGLRAVRQRHVDPGSARRWPPRRA